MCNSNLQHLLDKNVEWAKSKLDMDPDYFNKLASGHHPKYLWIGCSDARVPANTIVGIPPGDVFVHRNVGNVVSHGDMNAQAVIRYAVEVLKVEHVIVTGHYDCGAVKAVLGGNEDALNTWLYNIASVFRANKDDVLSQPAEKQAQRLSEHNVRTQVRHVTESLPIRTAWKEGRDVTVHGWVYSIEDGIIRDLDCSVGSAEQATQIFGE